VNLSKSKLIPTIGKVYVIATPIGNIEDITLRAIKVINNCQYIFSEDTRHSKFLLKKYQQNNNHKFVSLFEYNQKQRITTAISLLKKGNNIAVVSDAGTPAISDPGAIFIKELSKENIEIIPIPGACAAVSAYSVSGIENSSFYFQGFLPDKKNKLNRTLQKIVACDVPVIIYEAPHRLYQTINAMLKIFNPQRQIFIAREMTKVYEEYLLTNLEDLLHRLSEKGKQNNKGEWVLIIPPTQKKVGVSNSPNNGQTQQIADTLILELKNKLSNSQLARIIHKATKIDRKEIYQKITSNGNN